MGLTRVEMAVVSIEGSWVSGYGVLMPILNDLMMTDITGQTGLGLIESIANSFGLLATPVLGRMSDLYGRRISIVVGVSLGVLSDAAFIAAHLVRTSATVVAIGLIVLGRIIDQFSGGISPTLRAYMADCAAEGSDDSSKSVGAAAAKMSHVNSAMGMGFSIGECVRVV